VKKVNLSYEVGDAYSFANPEEFDLTPRFWTVEN